MTGRPASSPHRACPARSALTRRGPIPLPAAISIAVLGVAPLVGCGATQPCPREQTAPAEAAPDAGPKVRAGAAGLGPELCSSRDLVPEAAAGHTVQSWNRLWFMALGKRCACWEGKLTCVDPEPPQCFWWGRWYGESERAVLLEWCSCKASEWDCGRPTQRVIRRDPLVFRPGETTVLRETEHYLNRLAEDLRARPAMGVALTGLVELDEGKQAITLAQQRAESIRRALVQRGIADDRLLLLPVELDAIQGARVRRVHFEWIPKPNKP